ncbi:hypothetical protein C8Q78DRAFT_369662 [Trametes maxima]|nr:hypothetical protein C8Q78DRAFT_369662 [Trametes maxima]
MGRGRVSACLVGPADPLLIVFPPPARLCFPPLRRPPASLEAGPCPCPCPCPCSCPRTSTLTSLPRVRPRIRTRNRGLRTGRAKRHEFDRAQQRRALRLGSSSRTRLREPHSTNLLSATHEKIQGQIRRSLSSLPSPLLSSSEIEPTQRDRSRRLEQRLLRTQITHSTPSSVARTRSGEPDPTTPRAQGSEPTYEQSQASFPASSSESRASRLRVRRAGDLLPLK